jgi:hypothetical protein
MSKTINYKIFEYEKHQMLVRKDNDEENEETPYKINFEVITESGLSVSLAHQYSDKEVRDTAFANKISDELAKGMYDLISEALGNIE